MEFEDANKTEQLTSTDNKNVKIYNNSYRTTDQ